MHMPLDHEMQVHVQSHPLMKAESHRQRSPLVIMKSLRKDCHWMNSQRHEALLLQVAENEETVPLIQYCLLDLDI